jgi:cytoskeletal protein RodZ
MKKISLILAVVFALAMLPAAFAQSTSSPSQDPSMQQPSSTPSAAPSQQTPSQNPSTTDPSATSPSSSPSSAGSSDAARSFVGSIAKTGGKYVLHTGGTDYQLDDQSQAKKFEGKDVKVTGQLDASSNTIKVQSIDPASSM